MEEIRDQNNKILEILDSFKNVPADIADMKTDIAELKVDMKVVKSVLKDHSREIENLKSVR
jgi:uncharacterized coiled-coil DUF342 family protein